MTPATASGHSTGASKCNTLPNPQTTPARTVTSIAPASALDASQISRACQGVGGGKGISNLKSQISDLAAFGFTILLAISCLACSPVTDDSTADWPATFAERPARGSSAGPPRERDGSGAAGPLCPSF